MKLIAKTNRCIIANEIESNSKAMQGVKNQLLESLKDYPDGHVEFGVRLMTMDETNDLKIYDPRKYKIAMVTKTFVDQNVYFISHDRLVIHCIDEKNGEWQTWTKFGSARCVILGQSKMAKLKLDLVSSCMKINFMDFHQRREEMKHEEKQNPIEKR